MFFFSLSFVCRISFILFCFGIFFVLLAFVCLIFFLKEGREGDRFTEQGGRGVMYIGVEEDLSRDGKGENLVKMYFMKTTQTPGAVRARVLAKDTL